MTISIQIPDKRLADLLVGAFEGGSNYWLESIDINRDGNTSADLKHIGKNELDLDDVMLSDCYIAPFVAGCFITVREFENNHNQFRPLDLDSMKSALELLANSDNPALQRHFGDIVSGNDDATTADVFLQMAVFGELIYG